MMKYIFDLASSVAGVIVLSPFLVFLVCLVQIKMGKPVIFKQMRAGKGGTPFTLYKFRTMTNERDEKGNLLPHEQRLTEFGSFLRQTSLDELPELFNVMKGEMSLVGPRPLLIKYLSYYNEEQKCRHDVLPGITGWAQVNGRNSLGWDEKLGYDVWYVRNRSFMVDLNILRLTLLKVLKREGINHGGRKGMVRFDDYMKDKTRNNVI